MTEQDYINQIKKKGPFHLKNYKTDNITYQICETAVLMSGAALQFVPEKYRTEELCLAACKEWGHALAYVPENKKTQALCDMYP